MRRWGLLISIVTALLCSCKVAGRKPAGVESGPPRGNAIFTKPPVRDERPVIVTLGDSLTAGRGVDPGENYPARLQKKIDAAGLRYRVVNEGLSGDTSAQGLSRLSAIRRHHPVLVIVELGANDGLRGMPVEETRKNLAEIIRALRQDGIIVVLAGMRVPPNYGPDYELSFSGVFAELAENFQVALIPFFLEGVGGRAELNQEDGIHPTAEGYEIVTENVWKTLRPLLQK
jgi:acyl-CoA thioesterase-1